jgi:hypothetical protein
LATTTPVADVLQQLQYPRDRLAVWVGRKPSGDRLVAGIIEAEGTHDV